MKKHLQLFHIFSCKGRKLETKAAVFQWHEGFSEEEEEEEEDGRGGGGVVSCWLKDTLAKKGWWWTFYCIIKRILEESTPSQERSPTLHLDLFDMTL